MLLFAAVRGQEQQDKGEKGQDEATCPSTTPPSLSVLSHQRDLHLPCALRTEPRPV
jgi:hypothetical protein